MEQKARLRLHSYQIDEAIKTYDELLNFSEKHELIKSFQKAGSALGEMLVMRGNYSKAKEVFQKMLQPKYVYANLKKRSNVEVKLGYVHLESGEYDTAKQILEKVLDTKREIKGF